jgi:predicted transcriptional regulator of viral defense system
VVEVEVRGSKKMEALRKLLEVAGGGSTIIEADKLISILMLHGKMSMSYAVKVISELTKTGVLRRVKYGVYEVDVEKLKTLLEGGK